MKFRKAFSMIELIFVIVIMGIIAKFGTEFLAESYKSFIFSKVNNKLQANSATAVEFIASRLQHRIKDSVIAKKDASDFKALANADDTYTIIEWVSSDADGFRGLDKPYWSGIIDVEHSDATASLLISPETNTTLMNELIDKLSYGDSNIDSSAIYFIGSNSDINGYGWDGNALTDQEGVMHPIKAGTNENEFEPAVEDFSGVDIYEYYKFAWTANALVVDDKNNLLFYYDYQPWNGDEYNDGKSAVIVQNVSTFRAMAIGAVMKIQVCVKSILVEEYSLCKEKTIF